MHERLIQLERLVKSMAQKQANESGHAPALGINRSIGSGEGEHHTYLATTETSLDGRSDYGSLHVDASGVQYVGGDHWAAILDSIADLKVHFDQEEQLRSANYFEGDILACGNHSSSTTLARSHALLLYASHRPVSRAEILATLPPKSSVDRYISRYFNGQDLVSCWSTRLSLLHGMSANVVNMISYHSWPILPSRSK